ncbi:MAG: glucose 1-dehydrogenase [Syntrophomonadaceae bacterium]|nr:glucose 1-dehydrogenase [Syntrophomonadaceae bacterium]
MLEKFSLKGKVALVTGGGRGLGKGIALGLAGAGADVVVAARSADELAETAKELKDLGTDSASYQLDMLNVTEIRNMVDWVAEKYGTLDILVNGAGINVRKPTVEMTEADWDRVLGVNLKGVFFASQAAAKVMLQKGKGRIINVASLSAIMGIPTIVPYCSSKGGLVQMTKGMAVEWAPKINVNAIGPGYFRTAMTEELFQREGWEQNALRRIPQGKTGSPSDLAGAAVYLASEASDYVTGQVIYVDGGWLAC